MNPVATIRQGKIEGREKEGVLLFAGIPYATPPLGPLRFRGPEPHPEWSGVRPAQRFGAAAPQLPGGGLTDSASVRWDEDCLTLNVCTPALDGPRRPVLVWIHGGGFRTGQGAIPWYNGASFAKRGDLVVVSINYRLGALGFTHLAGIGGSDYASSGTNGIRDQIAALRWVRENIHALGGDPDRVTIAGESAGGMSVGSLLGCPSATGLFRGAIAQSGAAHNTIDPDSAGQVASLLARELAVTKIEELQVVPVQRLLAAQRAVETELARGNDPAIGSARGMPFQPTCDGHVLPRSPIEEIRAGATRGRAVLVGTNRHETTLFDFGDADDERLRRTAAVFFTDPDEAVATYRKADPDATPSDLLVAVTTDHTFRIPAVRLAEAHVANGGAAFVYLFTWESRGFSRRLGATHALEIPFAFNNLTRAGVDTFLGEGPLPQALADSMHDAWIAFVREGDPNGPGRPDWPVYDRERRPVMEFGERVGPLEDPNGAERRLWDGVR